MKRFSAVYVEIGLVLLAFLAVVIVYSVVGASLQRYGY